MSATASDVQTGRLGSKLTTSKSVVRVLRRIVGDPGDTDAVTILQDVIPGRMFWCLTVPVDDRVDMLIPIHEACITPCRDANLGIPPEPAALPAGGVGDDLEPILTEHLAQRLSEPSDVRAPGTDHSCAYEEGTPPESSENFVCSSASLQESKTRRVGGLVEEMCHAC